MSTDDVALARMGFAFARKPTEEELAIQRGIDATMRTVIADRYRPTDRDSGPGPTAMPKPRPFDLSQALLVIPPKPKAKPDV